MGPPAQPYVVDPDDPRAPPQDVWDRMTPEERARVVASLPSEFPPSESAPPEGDHHFEAKLAAREALKGFFGRGGRRVYLGSELPVYYPGEPVFAPDLIAVLDVDPHPRNSWIVSNEGKGVDLALEVHVAGDRRKDLERNIDKFARMGIREYFIFDRGRLRLTGFRLASESKAYQPILPQGGRYTSQVLELELAIEGERLRFFAGNAPLLETNEMLARLEGMVDQMEARARAAEERAEEEARKREEAERRLKEALAELERLKRSR